MKPLLIPLMLRVNYPVRKWLLCLKYHHVFVNESLQGSQKAFSAPYSLHSHIGFLSCAAKTIPLNDTPFVNFIPAVC